MAHSFTTAEISGVMVVVANHVTADCGKRSEPTSEVVAKDGNVVVPTLRARSAVDLSPPAVSEAFTKGLARRAVTSCSPTAYSGSQTPTLA